MLGLGIEQSVHGWLVAWGSARGIPFGRFLQVCAEAHAVSWNMWVLKTDGPGSVVQYTLYAGV